MVSGIMQGGCICENAPGLRIGTNNIEIAAMMAPKPMLLVAATGDWTRNVPREEFPAIRGLYELYGKPDMVEAAQFDAPHNYQKESREAVYAFLRKQLTPGEAPWKERGAAIEKLQDMLVWQGASLPPTAKTFEDVFAAWKTESRSLAQQAAPSELRERLRVVFGVKAGEAVTADGGFLKHAGRGDAVPFRMVEGRGPAVLVLHPEGMEAAAKLVPAGRAALLIDAFQTGSATAPRDRSHRHFLTFNVSDDAARVQDAVTAISFLRSRNQQVVEVIADGKARWWALFASALAPASFPHRADEFDGGDASVARNLFVPGIQRAGGVEAALRVLNAQLP
jgi:hypothetical protein